MMHNSLLIRALLRATNASPLHRERRDPHRTLRTDGPHTAHAGEMLLQGTWQVVSDATLIGGAEAADDLTNFLELLGVEQGTAHQIQLRHDSSVEEGGFRLTVVQGCIEVAAGTMAGIWAGITHLERDMATFRAPIVRCGVFNHAPLWKIQISQAPYGANYLVPDLSAEYLSDAAFRLLAHYGITGMTIYGDWLCYVRSERFPELNAPDYDQNIAMLRDAASRAARYGVRLYYVPVSPKLLHDHPFFERHPTGRGSRISPGLSPVPKRIHCLCSSDPETLLFHGEVFGDLVRAVPELGGLILIVGGESYYHCYMRPDTSGLVDGIKTNCPRCGQHMPEEVVGALLHATEQGVHAVDGSIPVVAWPYSAFVWSGDPQYLTLIEHLPHGVMLQTEIDKDHLAQKNGYHKRIWDYSVDFTGPSSIVQAQTEPLRNRDHERFIKTETAIGLETIHVPYVPSLQRHAEKWRNVREASPVGVLQSWMFFGMWGSRAEEIGWWTNWHPERSSAEVLRIIAERDFGINAAVVLDAWQVMSDAVGHLPYIPNYFTGPEFIGPAQPLLFEPDAPVPELFTSLLYYLQENEETFSKAVTEVRQPLAINALPEQHVRTSITVDDDRSVWDIAEREYACVVEAAGRAYTLLDGIAHKSATDMNLAEEILVVEYLYRCWLSTLHTIRFLLARERWLDSCDVVEHDAMVEIGLHELDNAKRARHIYADAPWLDLELRRDGLYPSSALMLETKIEMLETALRTQASAPGGG